MAQVIELHPHKIRVPTFNADAFARDLLEVVTVHPGDPRTKSIEELREETRMHLLHCACSHCEELRMRQWEGSI